MTTSLSDPQLEEVRHEIDEDCNQDRTSSGDCCGGFCHPGP